MDELKKLYDVLVRDGKYTKSFEEFQVKWGDQSYKDKVYEVVSRDGLYTKDKNSFLQKYSGTAAPVQQPQVAPAPEEVAQPVVEKKSPSVTTELPVAASSSAAPLPPTKTDDGGILSSIGKGIENVTGYVSGMAAEAEKSVLSFADDIVSGTKKLFEETNTSIGKDEKFNPLNPLDVIKVTGEVLANKTRDVINSALSQEQKNAVIKKLQEASDRTKYEISKREKLQEETLDDSITTKVLKGIAGFAPDLAVAALMKNPTVLESKYAATTARVLPTIQKISPKAAVVVEKYAPKAAKFTEEAVKAPMTKIFTAKGAVSGVANAKEDETLLEAGAKGAGEGFLEGAYMHGLGYVAGKTSPLIARGLSKTGMNSAISTAIANPLANAGVFATAKAIRTPIEEGRLATEEELAMEIGTGIGFSLLHAGSTYKNHKELNHYYDNTLKENKLASFGRTINETKSNLELVYDPNLTAEQIAEIKEARDEIKKAAILEPDLQKKIELGNEALKLQNKLDANFTVKAIIENKKQIIDEINKQEDLNDEQKSFFTKKVNAIADNFDNSEVGLKKKELNTKIGETQKTLSNLSEKFTNQTLPSDRAETKLEIDTKTKELEDLNNELNELVKTQKETKVEPINVETTEITANRANRIAELESILAQPDNGKNTVTINDKLVERDELQTELETLKKEQDAVQKQSTDESVLLTEQPQLGLQEVVEGNEKPQETTVTTEGTQEVTPTVTPEVVNVQLKPIEVTTETTGEPSTEGLSNVESFETSNGSVYTVLPDGTTQRFKTATGEQKEAQDLTVFAKLEGQKEQDFLEALQKSEEVGKKVYVVDEKGNIIRTNKEAEGKKIYLVIADKAGTKILDFVEASTTPKEGLNTYDQRSFKQGENRMTERHIGNKVSKINTKEAKSTEAKTTETKTPEPTTEATTEGKPKTALQEATEARKKAKAALKSLKEGMGISPDAKLEALVKYHKALVNEAKEYIKEKGENLEAWAKSIGERVTKITQKAWDEATEKIDPIEKGEDLDYTFEETFGEDIESLPDYEDTMEDIQLEADEAYKSIKYLKEVLKSAEAYHKKNNSEASKKRLEKAKAELKEYEDKFEKSKNKALADLEKSELFKTATDIQKELLIRDVLSRFGEKQKRSPKPEELFENVVEVNEMMEHIQYLFDDANKSKVFLDEQLAKAKKEYEDYKKLNKEDRNPDREEKLKQRVEYAKKEIEEYKTKNIEEAIKYISDSDVYKNASPAERKKMIDYVNNKFLKSQKTKLSVVDLFGKIVEEKTVLMTAKELFIKQINDLSRGGKDATKTIKEVTASIAKTLKDLQTKGELTVDQVNRILGKLGKLNMLKEDSVNKFIDDITEVFEDAQEAKTTKEKKTIIDKILDLVNKKAKTKILASGKRRSRGLDADGQLFFQSVREVLNAAAKNDTNKMMDIMNKLSSRQAEIDDAVQKEMTGQPLTLDETILLNEVMAFDTFGDMLNMSLGEIETLYDSLKNVRAESIKRLKDKRLESAAKKASMELEANDNIQEGFGALYNADGTLKNKNQLDRDSNSIYKAFKELKIWDGVKKYIARYDFNNKNFITNFFRNKIANVGTICNILDKSGSLFNKNVYEKLNKMNEKKRVGIESQTKLLDTLANKIFGTKKNGYQKFKYELAGKGTKDVVLNGETYTFNYGQLLRIYALSLNRVQRNKLKDMGFTEAKINEIKSDLGPEFVEFADGIVEYLSTDYFGTVNDVYRKVNDVNLNQIENYFPTKTVSKEANADLLQKGDFNGIFNAETSPAFKERLDKTSPIDLEPSFTDVLDNHLETMEMYKSHAEGVKEMNTFFNIESVKTLLDQTGLGPVLKFNVNNSVSPNTGAPIKAKGMDKIINSFTPFALAFKAMQFAKQATSIGAAYGDYSFRANKQTFLLDLPFWLADVAKVMATPRASIRKFKNISATFKERYDSGLAGDIVSVESAGRTFLPSSQKNTLLGKFKRGFKSAAGFATFAGDILSTFGYMANYNRDIKNGMNPEKALEKFNNYNATLQTKRPSEKSAIQHNQDFISRTITMFGSSGLLMMNTVSQSTKNILRSVNKGEAPKTRDIRKLVFAVGVGNALFIAASNAFKLMSGDEEDKDKAKEDIFEALIGLNLLSQLPIIGDAVEFAKSKIKGERYYDSSSTNPLLQIGKKMFKIYEEEEGNIVKALRPIAESKLGFQFEPFMGLINSTVEGEVDEDDMYNMLGVASSYRPTGEEEQEARAEKNVKEEDTDSKELESLQELINTETDNEVINEAVKRIEYLRMTDDEKKQYKKERKEEVKEEKAELKDLLGEYDSKDEMRRYDNALYEKTFGEGSDYYKKNEAKLKMEAKVRELEQEAEDKERGFSEPVKEKKSKKNSDGSYKRTYKRSYNSSYKRSYQSGN